MHALCQVINYSFNDPKLLKTALTHRSYSASNNERLEFLGDSLLNCIMAEVLYHQCPNAPEGDLSRVRSHLVQEQTLVEIATTLRLKEYILIGHGEIRNGGAKPSALADAVEAIIAAVFLDSTMEKCRAFVLALYMPYLKNLTTFLPENIKDAKTQLQEYLQSSKSPLPIYEIIAIEGEGHEQAFTVRCTVPSLKKETLGKGTSRRRAEQVAAQAFLKSINKC